MPSPAEYFCDLAALRSSPKTANIIVMRPLTRSQTFLVAAKAFVDPQTVARYQRREPIRKSLRERIEDALRAEGLAAYIIVDAAPAVRVFT